MARIDALIWLDQAGYHWARACHHLQSAPPPAGDVAPEAGALEVGAPQAGAPAAATAPAAEPPPR